MAKRMIFHEPKPASITKIAKSGKSFETLMTKIPKHAFSRMLSISGLPSPEARELSKMFKEIKG